MERGRKICEFCHHDPASAGDVISGKRRLLRPDNIGTRNDREFKALSVGEGLGEALLINLIKSIIIIKSNILPECKELSSSWFII